MSAYVLDPPGPSSLPPLPPVPHPSTSFRRTSVHTASSSSPKPELRPSIPSGSPFSNTSTVQSCLEALNAEGHEVQARYGDTAVWARTGDISAWIILKEEPNAVIRVRSVRIHISSEGVSLPAGHFSRQERPIHSQSTSAPHRSLSKHLTDLDLTLPELLVSLTITELMPVPLDCSSASTCFSVPFLRDTSSRTGRTALWPHRLYRVKSG